jgi:hypothetical protein
VHDAVDYTSYPGGPAFDTGVQGKEKDDVYGQVVPADGAQV